MTEEELQHAVSRIEQARATVDEAGWTVVHGSPSRGSWWDSVEAIRLAGEQLTSACAELQGRS